MATRTYNGVTLEVTKRQGWTLDNRTAAYFDAVNAAMPGGVVIIQGSYNDTVDASANTHNGPGALDLKPADPNRRNTAGYKLLEKIARQRGGAAWFRPWANNYHVHIIVIGTPGLPRVAANQVASYKAGRDGLVSNNRVGGIIITTFEKWKASVSQVVTGVGQAVSNAVRVKSLQKAVRRSQTGVWDEQTDIDLRNTRAEAVEKYTGAYFKRWNTDQKKRMQKTWGAYQDGIWGPATKSFAKNTVVAIQRALSVPADGVWGPTTDKAYFALKAKMYKKATPAKPAGETTGDIKPVSMTLPISAANIRMGKKNSDVARYQAALWNVMDDATRNNWKKKWKLSRTDIYDGVYGQATADMTKIVYNYLARAKPGQGWTAGATVPGPGLLRYIGFKNVK